MPVHPVFPQNIGSPPPYKENPDWTKSRALCGVRPQTAVKAHMAILFCFGFLCFVGLFTEPCEPIDIRYVLLALGTVAVLLVHIGIIALCIEVYGLLFFHYLTYLLVHVLLTIALLFIIFFSVLLVGSGNYSELPILFLSLVGDLVLMTYLTQGIWLFLHMTDGEQQEQLPA